MEEEQTRRKQELQTARALAATEQARANAESVRAREQKRAATRLRKRAFALAGSLVLLLALVVVALVLGQQARQAARLATSRELAAAALNSLDIDAERSVLLAMAALESARTVEAERALHRVLPALRVERTMSVHDAAIMAFDTNDDGSRLVTASWDGSARIVDWVSGVRQR